LISDKNGIWFPNYQQKRGMFNKTTTHDLDQWKFVKGKLTNSRLCLDFGGHVGTSAIRYAGHFDRVISFEPILDLYECLVRNTKSFANIVTHEVAISNQNGNVDIWLNTINTGSSVVPSESTKELIESRWGNKDRKEYQGVVKLTVESRTIDSYEFTDVDFIKIDTEGYTMEPLQGMKETLKRCHPIIQLERSNDKNNVNETHRFLHDLGYNLIKTMGNPPDDIFV
jgi:FkbM family methyltransferase